MAKEKKIVFSETTDSAINGYALGISFLGIGVFLLLSPNYFSIPVVSYILGAFMGVIGVFGVGIELSKSSKIKGMDNLSFGLVFLLVWAVCYLKIAAVWANFVSFVFLVLGAYAICLGLIQGIYSIVYNAKLKKENDQKAPSKGNIVSQIILLLTQVCGLAIAIFNVVKAASA